MKVEATAQAQAEAHRLDQSARLHKRLSEYHRRQARKDRQALAELVDACGRCGVRIEITQTKESQ